MTFDRNRPRPALALLVAGLLSLPSVAAHAQTRPRAAGDPAPRAAGDPSPRGTYLRLPGIQGGSKDAGHANWIDVASLDWGVAAPETGVPAAPRPRAAGRASNVSFTLVRVIDGATAKLRGSSEVGLLLPAVQLHVTVTAGGGNTAGSIQPHTNPTDAGKGRSGSAPSEMVGYEYELENVMVVSHAVYSPKAGARPEGVPPGTAYEKLTLRAESAIWKVGFTVKQ